jgi:hypothetical protein
MTVGSWQPMTELPQEPGRYVAVLQAHTYRWMPYARASAQRTRGVLGRWQHFDGYGWHNAEIQGLAWCDVPTPARPLPPVFTPAAPADAAQALRELLAVEDERMPSESAAWDSWRERRGAAWARARAVAAAPERCEPLPATAPAMPHQLRQTALARALRHAVDAGAAGEHAYLPVSNEQALAAGWQPHEWVVRAVIEALENAE